MRNVDWYYDFISPFSYLCLHRLNELPAVSISYRPVLFAGLLNHWGQKGPAEIPVKRQWTYRWCAWWAKELGIPFRFPASHPFNPLHHLRLSIAAGNTPDVIATIFDDIWTTGSDATDPTRFANLCSRLGVKQERLADQDVKDRLRENSERAIAQGVFGVPSFVVDREVFWGADSLGFIEAFIKDPSLFKSEEMQRLDRLPIGAARKS